MNADIRIRMANADDAETLLNIYAPYVETTPVTFECTVPTVEEFRARITNTLKKYPYLVAEIDQTPVGYTYASAFKDRAAYDWAVETSIYVDAEWHGCGIGHALYQTLEQWLVLQHITNTNACIAYPNPGSIRFHKEFGYKKVAHFTKCGYKLGAWHDMIWMEKFLGKHKDPPEPVVWLSDLHTGEKGTEKML